ncbi:hypothetical protein FOCC_FOCC012581 [Frankliniella occidentalis]|nr:hypothetical protein FOCC_FOCC012581 [Frankliniella occidentalis]
MITSGGPTPAWPSRHLFSFFALFSPAALRRRAPPFMQSFSAMVVLLLVVPGGSASSRRLRNMELLLLLLFLFLFLLLTALFSCLPQGLQSRAGPPDAQIKRIWFCLLC